MLHFGRAALGALSFAVAGSIAASAANVGGLSATQMRALRQLDFAVVPDPPPTGFHVASIRTDPVAESYRIVYLRPADEATLTIVGRRRTAAPTPAPHEHHGLFQKLAASLDSLGTKTRAPGNDVADSRSSNANTPQEEEEEMSSVSADSRVIGPMHFTKDHSCLSGNADSSRALIHNADFTVSGCNLGAPDPLIRAYRSLVRVGA